MKIVADQKIPFIKELLNPFGDVIQKAGESITQDDLIDATVLLVRTVTPINANLLNNTAVEFVGSATAGHDHMDAQWLNNAGITWAHTPGINATAVAEYVVSCAAYCVTHRLLPEKCRAGIIGVGHAGRAVEKKLTVLGFDVVLNDPPRAAQERHFISTPLEQLDHCDFVCVHTPLTTTGKFPTHHLLDAQFFNRLKPGCVLLNAGRGGVIDSQALLSANHVIACLDVWENEPDIDVALLKTATIATPHIAGYSRQAKQRASVEICQRVLTHFGIKHPLIEPSMPSTKTTLKLPNNTSWPAAILAIDNPVEETQRMKTTLLNDPQHIAPAFLQCRKNYQLRDEFSNLVLQGEVSSSVEKILRGLGLEVNA